MTPEQTVTVKRVALVVLGLVAIGLAIPLFLSAFTVGDTSGGEPSGLQDVPDAVDARVDPPGSTAGLQLQPDDSPAPHPDAKPSTAKPIFTILGVIRSTGFKLAMMLTAAIVVAAVALLSYKMYQTGQQLIMEEEARLQTDHDLELENQKEQARLEEAARSRNLAIGGSVAVALFGLMAVVGIVGVVLWMWLGSTKALPFEAKPFSETAGKLQIISMVGMAVIGLAGAAACAALFGANASFGFFGAVGLSLAAVAIVHLIRRSSYAGIFNSIKDKWWISVIFGAASVLILAAQAIALGLIYQ